MSLTECEKTVELSSVSLRVWDYPHFNRNHLIRDVNYVQCTADFISHIELWRYFQSGQFFHKFSCIEDWEPSVTGRGLDVLSTLYRMTEIYEFAMRLAKKDLLGLQPKIAMVLNDMQNRTLMMFDRSRFMPRDYVCTAPALPRSRSLAVSDLISNGHQIAIEETLWIFERFGWTAPHLQQMLETDQSKFLKGLM